VTTLILSSLYVVIGIVAALIARRQRMQLINALLTALLWPFLLPTLVQATEVPRPKADSPRLSRLESAARTLREAWAKGEPTWSAGPKERDRLEAFIVRLQAIESRLSEIDAAMQRGPVSLRERLERVRDRSLEELEQGLVLLEELGAQLTLLRFANVEASAERAHLEALLTRVGALAEVSTAEV
jgi:hypothetical protein